MRRRMACAGAVRLTRHPAQRPQRFECFVSGSQYALNVSEKPSREIVEALVNLATNGALDRIDQRGKRARELRQWGLHPHHAEPGSPLAADNDAFQSAYP